MRAKSRKTLLIIDIIPISVGWAIQMIRKCFTCDTATAFEARGKSSPMFSHHISLDLQIVIRSYPDRCNQGPCTYTTRIKMAGV